MPFRFGRKKEEPRPEPHSSTAKDKAPGWDAIDRALTRAYPGQEPFHWGTARLPGQDGIFGLSAYRDGPDWLFVTFGLSELFVKVSDDPLTSGWGFELTMRVPAANEEPPDWPRLLLDRLGAAVYSTGNPFDVGHRSDFRQPITGGAPPSRLTAAAFTADPILGSIETPNGALTFLTLVGITTEELERMKASRTAIVLEEMARTNPRLVTDPAR